MIERWGVQVAVGSGAIGVGLLVRMSVLSNVYDTVRRVRNLKGKEIHSLSDSERELISWLIKAGLFE